MLLKKIAESLVAVQENKPLIHHLTNYVTVNDCANMTLALGGSPVMADDIEEVEEMVAYAGALVLNIGTLNRRTVPAMLAAGKKARSMGIPVILDPVGVGATKLRTQTAAEIIRVVKPPVIRGNMSEIKILAGLDVAIKGVDSLADEQDKKTVAQKLAGEWQCVIAITGKQDVVSDGVNTCLLDNGHELLAQVTGTGCMTTSLIGTFCGATKECFVGAAAGIMAMGLAGEYAQRSLHSDSEIGTFHSRLFDGIRQLTPAAIRQEGRITCD